MEKDGGSCSAHDTGGGGEAPAGGLAELREGATAIAGELDTTVNPGDAKGLEESKGQDDQSGNARPRGEKPSNTQATEEGEGHSLVEAENPGDTKRVEESQFCVKEPDHPTVAEGEPSGSAEGVAEQTGNLAASALKVPPQLQQSFSCPAALDGQSPADEAEGSAAPQDPAASTPGDGPQTTDAKPGQAPGPEQEPAGERPSLVDKGGGGSQGTLGEAPPHSAPEGPSEAEAKVSPEGSNPAEPPSTENQKDAAAPVESADSLVEAPTSPYLTPDFGKEDPFQILDDTPPPPAPFTHRIVQLRSADFKDTFCINTKEMLGGGKFGEVRTCTVKETGLKLAVKIIRKQGPKDKEMAEVEIDVMNQLNHMNLIQLYDAIETPREILLFMEFVQGGELFERIIDEDYQLTEVDCMVFVRQICDGILFMHQMRVLHLDLKPENILCVTATGHMVKIIDFGLARRYNPTEKLKVNFGTPEFLSPEVVSYEQVSYTTDMWSLGVITYMLLSGLSPFLGDSDTETLNNVLAANWYFDEEAFEGISEEAKDFVSNLIIKNKSGRMNAAQCLQHPWLNKLAEKAKSVNRRLKSQVLLRKYVMRRRWKKNFIGVCAANRFKKITSSGSLTALGV